MRRTYRITDRDGGYVCERGTKRECVELLEKYVGSMHWNNEPYHVLRVEITHVRTFRKATPTKGSAK